MEGRPGWTGRKRVPRESPLLEEFAALFGAEEFVVGPETNQHDI